MLTRLQVSGFKNLVDVDIRFGPFTCIVGPNGVGKSNVFDAIRFLSLLTRHPILEAAREIRETKGRSPEPSTLFTTFEGYRAPEIAFAAEMVVARDVEDDFGVSAHAAISSLRYEVKFRLSGEPQGSRLELVEESLQPVRVRDAAKNLGFKMDRGFRDSALVGVRRGGPFISTTTESGLPEVKVHQEGHGGRRVPAPKSSWTVLGGTASADFPTVLAAHREMASWQTLLLEPSAMRSPSFYSDPKTISPQGGNLPGAITRLARTCGDRVLAEIANRLCQLIEDVREVAVHDDERTESLTVMVRGRDGVFHPGRSLSDGTLRFLVLTTLALDPEFRGLVCLEEPENGIHPDRVPAMTDLLSDIAVDPQARIGPDNPLRQVIVNTHSPRVVEALSPDEVLFLDEMTVVRERHKGRMAFPRVSPGSWRARFVGPAAKIPPGRLRPYLDVARRRHRAWEQLALPLAELR